MNPTPAPHGEDYLSCSVAAFQGNPELDRIIAASADAIMAFYRFAKNVLIHALDNDAVLATVESSFPILREFGALVGDKVSFTFVGDTVFVCGELLKAARGIYESAIELGNLLRRCSVVEVSLEPDFTKHDLFAFARPFVKASSMAVHRGALITADITNIKVRKFDAELEAKETDHEWPTRDQILMLYANGLVVLRGHFDKISAGQAPTPQKLKRIAQRLVTLAETHDPTLLGMTTLANAHRDDAGRALQTAILAVKLGQSFTKDRLQLARLAMAALMADAGRAREVGVSGRDLLVGLDASTERRIPSTTGSLCIASGGISESAASRSVVAYEATWLEREGLLGPLYANRLTPTLQGRVLRVVRALLDRLAPRDTARAMSPIDALHAVLEEPYVDPLMSRLLVATIGFVPTGTVVELDTGEWGVVIGPSGNLQAINRPLIRMVTDRSGRAVHPAVQVDLGDDPSASHVRIARVVDPGKAGFNVSAAFAA